MRAVWAAGLIVACSAVVCHASVDYLSTYNSLNHRSSLNAIGQTFIAEPEQLLDASILLCEPDPNVGTQWWPQARFQLRSGLPGNLDGSSGNVLFNSSIIDFSTLPGVGTAFNGEDVFELKLSDVGYSSPISLIGGQTYSLVIWDPGSTGTINYAEQQPSSYPGGGHLAHTRAAANGTWASNPSPISDSAFKVVTTPEPGCAMVWVGAIMLAATRRSGSRGSR
jgi:hypothetical protein